jgi:hypothetical protein
MKKDRVKVTVNQFGVDWYMASAHDGTKGVHNCFGTTPEAAKAMARLKLKQFQEEVRSGIRKPVTHDFTTQGRRNKKN